MIGVGGWRNRTATAGPYWFYRDGKLVSGFVAGVPPDLTARRASRSR